MKSQVTSFVSRRWSVPEARLQVEVERLSGGLESDVTRAHITGGAGHPTMPRRMVVKKLPGGSVREAGVYASLWRHLPEPPAVRVLGAEHAGGSTYLYLEDASSVADWPWSDPTLAAAVCGELGRLHDSAALPAREFSWDYDGELQDSARSTLELAWFAVDARGQRYWRRPGDLKRVAGRLAEIRTLLLSKETTVIHGDVHPGNVLLRRGQPDPDVVLIDWGRARIGSPLEDVASWLHSLGCWEPEARRRHDTLMAAYLDSRVVRRAFNADLRRDYWFASACNGLAGAIRYHLAVLGDRLSTEAARADSQMALAAWERVIRQAAALLSTSRARCM